MKIRKCPVLINDKQHKCTEDVVLQADVIVSTVHPCLDMKIGTMSQSVLQSGGESLQKELTMYLQTNGRAQMGKVVCTSGGDLQCQHVYHLSLPMWQVDKGQVEQRITFK